MVCHEYLIHECLGECGAVYRERGGFSDGPLSLVSNLLTKCRAEHEPDGFYFA